ncbi:MAG: hypothetical protein Q9216_006742 [Gyalolechia sp. 2 TL-2023]
MFAGSCIGVILLVVCLEGLRRAQREYDAYLVRQYHMQNTQGRPSPHESISETGDIEANNAKRDTHQISVIPKSSDSGYAPVMKPQRLVPTVFQQALRALIHMLQFAVAYFIMLLAMYYNGYIIICIIIGAYLGSFIFSWEGIHISDAYSKEELEEDKLWSSVDPPDLGPDIPVINLIPRAQCIFDNLIYPAILSTTFPNLRPPTMSSSSSSSSSSSKSIIPSLPSKDDLPSKEQVASEVVETTKSSFASGIRSFAAGGVGGVCAVVVGHPFDLVKVRLQTAEKGVYSGAVDVVRKTIAREGLARV